MNYRIKQGLFCPADKENMYQKAIKSEAELIIFDWEDAVALENKATARTLLYKYLIKKTDTKKIAIRTNPIDTKEGLTDLLFLSEQTIFPDYLVFPKIESPAIFELSTNILSSFAGDYILMIETAKGLNHIGHLLTKKANKIAYILLGSADFSSDVNAENNRESLAYYYGKIVSTCSEFNIPILDSPFFDINNLSELEKDTEYAKNMGMAGRIAIHPKQLSIINKVFSSSKNEIEKAKKIIKATQNGVAIIEGQMIDKAMALKAEKLLKNNHKQIR